MEQKSGRIKNEKAADMMIGKWVKCDNCKEIIYKEELHKNLSVCPNCGKHFRLSARRRIKQIVDEGTFEEIGKEILTKEPCFLKNSRIPNDESRIPSDETRIPDKNSRIPSENSRIPSELFEKIKIIYEDDDILVISKPSGLVVHEASSLKGESTLVDFLKQSGRQLATLGGEFRAGIVHRLDRYTSGVMVVAKSDFASAELSSQLQQKTASRIYIALCDLPLKQNCVVERAIGRCENNRLKKAVYTLGKKG